MSSYTFAIFPTLLSFFTPVYFFIVLLALTYLYYLLILISFYYIYKIDTQLQRHIKVFIGAWPFIIFKQPTDSSFILAGRYYDRKLPIYFGNYYIFNPVNIKFEGFPTCLEI